MSFYSRRLHHWHPEEAAFFVTWRLKGTLPKGLRRTSLEDTKFSNKPQETAFLAEDRRLDRAQTGPLWLRRTEVARGVEIALLEGDHRWNWYRLDAWVIMPNHIHTLMKPNLPLHRAVMNVKSATARAANRVLGKTGRTFWQDEFYDHWIRTDTERARIIDYIEYNPVAAGFASEPEEYPWSSARVRLRGQKQG